MSVHDRTTQSQTHDPASWLDMHGDFLFGYALSKVRHVQAAEDLVQETLLSAIPQRASFEGRSTIRTWLVGILKHKILDQRRCQQRRVKREILGVEAREAALARWTDEQFTKSGKWRVSPARWKPISADPGEQEELRQALAKCMSRLPDRAAEAIALCERQNLPAAQIGKILGVSATNVGVLLFRARSALRRCMEENWFTGQSRRNQ